MKTLAAVVLGVAAVLFGGSLLLFAFQGALVYSIRHHGSAGWLGVACGLFAPGLGRLTLVGLGLVLAGIALALWASFPDRHDTGMGRAGRLGLLWGLAGLGTLGLLATLLGVTLSTLRLG